MNLKISIFMILFVLISSVTATQFIGSFTVKESEKPEKSTYETFIEFIKNLPIVGYFAVKSQFNILAPPVCYTIPDQETSKNTNLVLNLSDFFDDPNADSLIYSQNFTYENLTFEFDQINETATLIPAFSFVGVINFIVIRATDSSGLFCDSNPFKLTVIETETPPPPPPTQQSVTVSAGGGGGTTQKIPNFILSKNVIELEMYPLEEITESVDVINIGDTGLNIRIINDFPEFVSLITKEISLGLKERKPVEFIISAPDIEPDIYIGKMKFIGAGITRTLTILVNLIEREAGILVNVIIPDEYKKINAGEEIKADVIINAKEIPREAIDISYQIRDIENNVVSSEIESFTLNDFNAKIQKTLQTKEDIQPGFYQFFVRITSEEKAYVATDIFEIVAEPKEETPGIFTLRNIIIVIGLIIVILLIRLFLKSSAFAALMKKLKQAPQPEHISLSRDHIRILTIEKLQHLYRTLDNGDYIKRYLLILREFLTIFYSIKYRFTMQEAIKEIRKKEKNEFLIKLLDKIGYVFYMQQQPTIMDMKEIIKSTIKILKNLKTNTEVDSNHSSSSLKR